VLLLTTETVNKANSIMGLVWRTMKYTDVRIVQSLYTALEYANQI
jgi:hypothetical protein